MTKAKKTDKETDSATSKNSAETSDDSQSLRDRLEIIRNRQAEIDEAAKDIADIKEELKAAKDKWEGLVVGLGEFIRGPGPLFKEEQSAVGDSPRPALTGQQSAKEETD